MSRKTKPLDRRPIMVSLSADLVRHLESQPVRDALMGPEPFIPTAPDFAKLDGKALQDAAVDYQRKVTAYPLAHATWAAVAGLSGHLYDAISEGKARLAETVAAAVAARVEKETAANKADQATAAAAAAKQDNK
jgi:hypothetical protein